MKGFNSMYKYDDKWIDMIRCIALLNCKKAWQYSRGYGIIVGILDFDPLIESSQTGMLISSIASGVKYIHCEIPGYIDQITVIDQMNVAIDSGCHVFCCSTSFKDLENEKEWEDVIEKALNNNMIIVAPTGNDNRNHINYPAALEGVVSVGSCDDIGNRWIQTHWNGSNYGQKIECVCPTYYHPRSWVWQKIDGGAIACANMCGVVALLKSVKKDLSYHEVQDLIMHYSSHSVIGFNADIGYGIPDVFRMISSIAPAEVEPDRIIKVLNNVILEIESIKRELGE